jgi:hypothetical protein
MDGKPKFHPRKPSKLLTISDQPMELLQSRSKTGNQVDLINHSLVNHSFLAKKGGYQVDVGKPQCRFGGYRSIRYPPFDFLSQPWRNLDTV